MSCRFFWTKKKPKGKLDGSVEVQVRDKAFSEFKALECLEYHTRDAGPIWCMDFSLDGKYLAMGGHDKRVTVIKTLLTENGNRDKKILQWDERVDYAGHTGDISDLCWSPLQFLASASLDGTVRLWHISQKKCLHIFQHPDAVSCVAFDPLNPNAIVSGCFDGVVRLWMLGETCCKFSYCAGEGKVITAISFTANGSVVVAGTMDGSVLFLDPTNGLAPMSTLKAIPESQRRKIFLKDQIRQAQRNLKELISAPSQVLSKSSHKCYSAFIPQSVLDRRRRARLTRHKITGIRPLSVAPQLKVILDTSTEEGDQPLQSAWSVASVHDLARRISVKEGTVGSKVERELAAISSNVPTHYIAISSNNCVGKIVDTHYKTILARLRGCISVRSQIKTFFSQDGLYAISGSEGGSIYIWNTIPSNMPRPNILWTLKIWQRPKAAAASTIGSPTSSKGNAPPPSILTDIQPPANECEDELGYIKQYPQCQKASEDNAKNGFEIVSGFTQRQTIVAIFAPSVLEAGAFHVLNGVEGAYTISSLKTFRRLRQQDPACNRMIVAADTDGTVFVFVKRVSDPVAVHW